jgi:hypothetical protein
MGKDAPHPPSISVQMMELARNAAIRLRCVKTRMGKNLKWKNSKQRKPKF